jgi:class 3 adenylate cyclase
MKCPNCQFENPESLKFCGECGAKLERICSECGSPNPPQFKFCGECGKDLVSPKSIITDYSKPQSYTPKFLTEKILTTRSSIEGERKLVTVLFADVANYTAMSESLGPEEVHQIMDVCFGILMDKVHKHEGTINQFTGDGIMALFGAPVAHEDHAQRACHAALSIQQALSDYSEKVKKDIGLDFSMRIGLNSGPVIVGAIGDDLRMDYTAIGDTTNLASRMENMAKPGAILVSDGTHRLVKDYFEFKSLGKVAVKGKAEPQETFELLRMAEVVSRIEAARIKGLTRFVGRANSMASLMDAYTNAKNGSGQVVGIVGEAGVGKSRLLLEFRSRLPQGLFTYYEGRCLHYGGSMPYIPILDILKSEFDIKYDQREFIVKKRIRDKIIQFNVNLAETIPPIQDLLSLKVDDKDYLRLEPIQRKNRVFEAI